MVTAQLGRGAAKAREKITVGPQDATGMSSNFHAVEFQFYVDWQKSVDEENLARMTV